MKEALISDEFDVVTLQQASHYSVDFETYRPYLDYLVKFIRTYQPKAKLVVHKTWAYEEPSAKLKSISYPSRAAMFADLSSAYARMAEAIGSDAVIPSADLIERLSELGLSAHRDTFHLSLGVGRYAVALLWLWALCGVDGTRVPIETDVPMTAEERELVFRAVRDTVDACKL